MSLQKKSNKAVLSGGMLFFRSYSFAIPEEARGRSSTWGTPGPSMHCQAPRVTLAKPPLGAWCPFLRWDEGISAGTWCHHRLQAGTTAGQGAGMEPAKPFHTCTCLITSCVTCGEGFIYYYYYYPSKETTSEALTHFSAHSGLWQLTGC